MEVVESIAYSGISMVTSVPTMEDTRGDELNSTALEYSQVQM
jgi:hypothetical protein